jgi:hypothetical protein
VPVLLQDLPFHQVAVYMQISDSQRLLQVPRPVRWMALAALFICFFTAIFVTTSFIGQEGMSDWILLSVSAMQIAASGIVVTCVVFYAETQLDFKTLERKTDVFLTEQVPLVLAKIRNDLGEPLSIVKLERTDIFGARYCLSDGQADFSVWIGLNVDRIIVVYFVQGSEADVNPLRDKFSYTFGGAEKVGYSWFVEPAVQSGEKIVSLWLAAQDPAGILSNPSKRLFWAQDIAMMTQSFFRTARRTDTQFPIVAKPGPL